MLRNVLLATACLVIALPAMATAASAKPTPAQAAALMLRDKAETIPMQTKPQEAVAALTQAQKAIEKAYPAGDREVGVMAANLGEALFYVDDYAGSMREFKRALAILDAVGDHGPAYLNALASIGTLERLAGHFDVAKTNALLSLDARLKYYPHDHEEVAVAYFDLSQIYFHESEFDKAAEAAREALTIREKVVPPGDSGRILTELALGNALIRAGRWREGMPVLRGAVQHAEAHMPAGHPFIALTSQELAGNMMFEQRFAEAADILEHSIAELEKSEGKGGSNYLGNALFSLSVCRLILGDFKASEAAGLRAVAIHSKNFGEGSEPATRAMTTASGAALAQGKVEQAVTQLTRVVDLIENDPKASKGHRAQAHVALAAALSRKGDVEGAIREARFGLPIFESQPNRKREWGEAKIDLGSYLVQAGKPAEGLAEAKAGAAALEAMYDRLAAADRPLRLFGEGQRRMAVAVEVAYAAGDLEGGFHLAQVLLESETGQAAAAVAARLSSGSTGLSAALRARQQIANERVKLDGRYAQALAENRPEKEPIREEMQTRDAALAAADAALDRNYPDYRALSRPQPLTVAEAQGRLADGEALILALPTREALFTFSLSRTSATWDRSPLTRAQAQALVDRIRAGVGRAGPMRAAVDAPGETRALETAFDRQAAHDLYRAIFTPKIEKAGRPNAYVIATGGPLSQIPFSLLVTETPRGGGDAASLRRTPWLVRRASVVVTPAVASLSREAQTATHAGGFFGAGAPALDGRSPPKALRGAGVDVVALKALPPLPAADRELRAMAGALGGASSRVLTGAEATEGAVKAADLSHDRVIAFATHGLVSGEIRGLTEPALVFTPPAEASEADDGLLTASEAAKLTLNADWVILSACDTASGEAADSPGYTGLARAFIFAGGRNVMASHWPVRDDAAARLTVDAVGRSARGETSAQALRKAMLAMIDDRGFPGGSDPAVWAPFMVVGR